MDLKATHHHPAKYSYKIKGFFAGVLALLLVVFIRFQYLDTFLIPHMDLPAPMKLKIYNQNVRYATPNPGENERPWSERKHELVKSIKFNTFGGEPVIVTLQEVLHSQLVDLLTILNDHDNDWTYFGVGRNDGNESGEYAPVLFKKSQFSLIDNGTFWLSETPDIPSRGWDADQERIVTWARLKHNHRSINVFTTHLDHIGVVARKESMKLIVNKTRSYNDDISFITGDFNSERHEEAYQTLVKVFNDSRDHSIVQYGFNNTFTDFDQVNGERHKIIDYIFIDQRLEKVEGFGVLGNYFGGIYSSDHRPVVAEVLV